MALLKTRLKAATLIESLVAMVIIVVCFSVATMIYVNVINSDKQRMGLKAMQLLDKEVQQLKNEKNFLDEEKKVNGWIVKKTLQKYAQTDNLYHLMLTVKDTAGRIVAKRNELIAVE